MASVPLPRGGRRPTTDVSCYPATTTPSPFRQSLGRFRLSYERL